jgi:hypothetical protein
MSIEVFVQLVKVALQLALYCSVKFCINSRVCECYWVPGSLNSSRFYMVIDHYQYDDSLSNCSFDHLEMITTVTEAVIILIMINKRVKSL